MKKRSRFLTAVVYTLTLFFCFAAFEAVAATQMPSFSLEDVRNGKTVDSSVFDGKVLLLTFFATWCPPCAEEVPVLNQLHEELSDSGFSVVGLSVDQQGASIVSKFVSKKDIKYPVLMAKSKTTVDFGGIYGIPVAFLVNKAGHVVKKYSGYVQHDILQKDVRSLLN
jgi:peroxiredoxin